MPTGRAAEHVRAFAGLMNNRNGRHLHHWIAQVQADDLPALHTFTVGLISTSAEWNSSAGTAKGPLGPPAKRTLLHRSGRQAPGDRNLGGNPEIGQIHETRDLLNSTIDDGHRIWHGTGRRGKDSEKRKASESHGRNTTHEHPPLF